MKVNQSSSFKKLILFIFAYTVLVILWGAWVRISHSGDGCGQSWPTCQGSFIPDFSTQKTWIEYAHRVMSGLYGFLIFGSTLAFVKKYGAKHPYTKMSYVTLVLTIIEALLGAKLVLSGLVAMNSSIERAFIVALHQINSLLLSGSIIWSYLLISFENPSSNIYQSSSASIELKRIIKLKNLILIIPFLLIATSGSWAALSGSLFPSESLLHGLQQDLSENAHAIIRLRIAHPLLALLLGGSLAFYFYNRGQKETELLYKKIYSISSSLFFVGLIFGISTLIFLSPIWMKLTHLLIVHILWAQLLTTVYQRN